MRRLGILLAVGMLIGAACGDDAPAGVTAAPETSAPETSAPGTTAIETGAPSPSGGGASAGSLVLLGDDFQDGDAAGWEIDEGWYVLGAGSAYGMAANGPAWVWWTGGLGWSPPYALRASFRIDAGGLAASVAVGEKGRYVVHLHETGTDLLLERPWGSFTALGSAAAVEQGRWHQLAAGFDDDRLQVYVDGEPWVAASIPEPLAGGSVGFGALDGSMSAFDNVFVTVLADGLPPFPGPIGPVAPVDQVAPPPAVDHPPIAGPGPGEEPSAAPDLRIRSFMFGSPNVAQGASVVVSMVIANDGGTTSGPCEAAWESMGSSCTAEVPTIDPGGWALADCTAPGMPAGLHAWTAHVDHDGRVDESNEGNNLLTGIVEVTATAPTLPDLFFADGNPATLAADEPYDLWVLVDDANGVGFDRAFTTRFLLNGQLACSVDLTGAPAHASCTLPALAAGAHVVEVRIDPDDEIVETRNDNNTWVWEVSAEGGRPDLRFSPAPTVRPPAGQPFDVTATVIDHNGSGFQGDFEVGFSVDDRVVCTAQASGVPATVSCRFPPLAVGSHEFGFEIDPTGAVDETIEHNNTYTVPASAG